MSRRRVIAVTLGVMLSLFMSAVEVTVVATAMPTIVSQLGGLARYSWVFSAYMVASTTTMPLYGKLSDVCGRRPIFLVAMGLFLAGSILSGQSQSMGQLIGFRTLQGLGAGGMMPLAFIIIGDLFSFEKRARMQGLFSGIWGLASIVGPLAGGFLVDQLSWRWVFYINVGPGFLSAILMWAGWREPEASGEDPGRAVDYAGSFLLSAGVVVLLLGLFKIETGTGWLLIGLAGMLFTALYPVERAAADPVLPLSLFRDRLFAVGTAQGLFGGWAMFGSTSFVPLFMQLALGTSATVAGSALAPQMVGWVFASILCGRLILHFSYRKIVLTGMSIFTAGCLMMAFVSADTPFYRVLFNLSLMGIGMGLTIPTFTIAVQSSVDRGKLGTATATLQFSRVIGGALGVSVMGLVLSLRLTANLKAAGVAQGADALQDLIRPHTAVSAIAESALRGALAGAVESVFVVAFVAALAGLAASIFTPKIPFHSSPPKNYRDQSITPFSPGGRSQG